MDSRDLFEGKFVGVVLEVMRLEGEKSSECKRIVLILWALSHTKGVAVRFESKGTRQMDEVIPHFGQQIGFTRLPLQATVTLHCHRQDLRAELNFYLSNLGLKRISGTSEK